MNPTRSSHHPSRRRWPWPLLLVGSGICCAAILLSPWMVLHGEPGAALSVRYVFSHLCHQDPPALPQPGGRLPACVQPLPGPLPGRVPGSTVGAPWPAAVPPGCWAIGPCWRVRCCSRAWTPAWTWLESGAAPSGRGSRPAGRPAWGWGSTWSCTWRAGPAGLSRATHPQRRGVPCGRPIGGAGRANGKNRATTREGNHKGCPYNGVRRGMALAGPAPGLYPTAGIWDNELGAAMAGRVRPLPGLDRSDSEKRQA